MLYRGITLVVVMNQQLTTLCVVAVHGGGVEASDLQLSRSLRFRDMLMLEIMRLYRLKSQHKEEGREEREELQVQSFSKLLSVSKKLLFPMLKLKQEGGHTALMWWDLQGHVSIVSESSNPARRHASLSYMLSFRSWAHIDSACSEVRASSSDTLLGHQECIGYAIDVCDGECGTGQRSPFRLESTSPSDTP